jgi:hypothetical protein
LISHGSFDHPLFHQKSMTILSEHLPNVSV